MDIFFKKLDKLAIFVLIYSLIFITFVNTLSYTIPFVLALIFAYLLQKPTNFLTKKFNISKSISALITTLILSSLIVFILFYTFTFLSNQIVLLTKTIQGFTFDNYTKVNTFINSLQKIYKNLDPAVVSSIEKNISDYSSKILSGTLNISGQLMSFFLNFFSYIPYLILVFLFTLLSTYFFTKDFYLGKEKLLNLFPSNKAEKILFMISETKRMLLFFCLSNVIIIGITFVETLFTYLLFGVNYAIILSFITAFCDFIPIIGIGTVFLPLSFIYFLYGNFYSAIGLLIAYTIISIIRQIIGPKVFSSTLGIHPVASLVALFIGLKAYGVYGFFYGLFLLVFYNIIKSLKLL